jgi:YidC/Oxa1 family membrane protein insertase
VLSAHLHLLAENSLFKDIGQGFHPLLEAVGYVLALIYGVVHNYAIAIILLTIVIMGLLTPLTVKSTKSMIAMQTLQPEMQKLRAKYKGPENREQLNQEMMRLYKEAGVSPVGGCIPMLLQMPFLYVLYAVIHGVSNTIAKGKTYPTGTVLKTGAIATGHQKCMETLCAVPRYIPTSSTMYHNLVATPGVMKAFGMNLAVGPFANTLTWYERIPYFLFILAAIGLQYLQMAQVTRRNARSGQQVPQQMQQMQKVFPLVFGVIYIRIPAGVVLYMIVSSGIRILTQDLMFRSGFVQLPGERTIGAEKGAIEAKSKEKPASAGGGGKVAPAAALAAGSKDPVDDAGDDPPQKDAKDGSGATTKPAAKSGGTGSPKAGSKGTGTNGTGAQESNGASANGDKAHSQSKSKRTRKAR